MTYNKLNNISFFAKGQTGAIFIGKHVGLTGYPEQNYGECFLGNFSD